MSARLVAIFKNAGWLGPTSRREDSSSQKRGSHPTRPKIMGWGFPPV
ncbi:MULTISPECIES: hypothetical protein [Microcoleaceae]|nr:hypothetical protein [Tychonema sp. LEGE 06208]MBE9164707.1 hypothetical protein [Tychonema sp. LEGE 06208]